MTRYVALLRSINVAGTSKLAMADLRGVFVDLGHQDVVTYLQTGNVGFTAADGVAPGDEAATAAIAGAVEQRLRTECGVTTRVLIRSGDELAAMLGANPYAAVESDPARIMVTFLDRVPTAHRADWAERLKPPEGESARCTLVGREVFVHCPDGYGRTKLNNAFIERRLTVAATTRNWRTAGALRDLAAE